MSRRGCARRGRSARWAPWETAMEWLLVVIGLVLIAQSFFVAE
ncbi:MAG: hypothetical protein DIU80_004815 [Chloroflexota bacterium]